MHSHDMYWRLPLATILAAAVLVLAGAGAIRYARAEGSTTAGTPGNTIPPLQPFTKSALETKKLPGDIVAYQITFKNDTLVTYTEALVGITDSLPVGLVALEPITASTGTSMLIHDRLLTWSGELTYGEHVTITYQALVMPNLVTATLTNTAVLWEQRGPSGWVTNTTSTLTATSVIQVRPFWPKVYMPQLSAPPPPTPTPTPPPLISLTQLDNWDFEHGRNGDWEEKSNDKPGQIIYRNGEKITLILPKYQGQDNQYFAWLGGEYSAINILEQSITLPTKLNQLALTFDSWSESADECGTDIAKVFVNGSEIGAYSLCKTNNSPIKPNTGGWSQQTLNIAGYSALAGQTVPVRFQVNTNSSKNSNWYIDNVRLCSTDPLVAVQDRCQ